MYVTLTGSVNSFLINGPRELSSLSNNDLELGLSTTARVRSIKDLPFLIGIKDDQVSSTIWYKLCSLALQSSSNSFLQ